MTTPAEATIVPIEIDLHGRSGVTLWAPPWEEDGDEWQAFLGSGSRVDVFESTEDLAAHIARSADNDLVDHPAWDMVQTLPPEQLEAEPDYRFNFDLVPELVRGKPTGSTVADLADAVDMVQRIAECVDDGPLQRLLEGPVFATLLEEDDPSYDDEDWEEVQTAVERSWPLLTERLEGCLTWHMAGEAHDEAENTPANFWDSVGILPVALTEPGGRTGYTLRCYLEDSAIFLGSELTIDLFTSPAELIEFCRTEDGHDLADLDTWPAVRDAPVLNVSPAPSERYDLAASGAPLREIAGDIADYCQLAGVQEALEADDPDWEQIRAEITTALRWHE